MTRHCLNCDAELTNDYCAQCGQRDVDLERPFPTLARELIEEAFQLDGRVARTLLTLVRKPGELTRQYLAGRRQLYTSPLRLYLVISLLFFVVAAGVVRRGILSDGQTLEGEVSRQAQFLSDELPQLMFVLLPAFALLLKFAFRHRRYLQHLIHSLHLHSAAYLVLMFLLPLERAAETNPLLFALQLALFSYLVAYLVISMRRVYEQSWLSSGVKAIALFLAYAGITAMVLEGLGNAMPAGP
jgi:hypothetical protein